jgi:hypothetical protein
MLSFVCLLLSVNLSCYTKSLRNGHNQAEPVIFLCTILLFSLLLRYRPFSKIFLLLNSKCQLSCGSCKCHLGINYFSILVLIPSIAKASVIWLERSFPFTLSVIIDLIKPSLKLPSGDHLFSSMLWDRTFCYAYDF